MPSVQPGVGLAKKPGTKRKSVQVKAEDVADVLDTDAAFKDAFYTDSSSGDEVGSQLTARGKLKKPRGRKPKRPRTAAPQLPGISDDEKWRDHNERNSVQQMQIQVKIVDGLDGPQLKLNLADILSKSRISIDNSITTLSLQVSTTLPPVQKPTGFDDIPFEISVKIYRILFVTQDKPIMLTERRDLQRTAQLLRTCRKVHLDGAIVLYGENSFHFTRAHKTRGTYFEDIWNEIGYKDVRRFLHDIGPQNMAKLKYVSFEFEDALPTYVPQGTSWYSRQYFNDAILIEIMHMIARYTTLEKLAIGFRGKSNLSEKEYHLLRAMCAIRCYEFSSDQRHGMHRITYDTYHKITRLVQLPPRRDVDKSRKQFVPVMFKDKSRFST